MSKDPKRQEMTPGFVSLRPASYLRSRFSCYFWLWIISLRPNVVSTAAVIYNVIILVSRQHFHPTDKQTQIRSTNADKCIKIECSWRYRPVYLSMSIFGYWGLDTISHSLIDIFVKIDIISYIEPSRDITFTEHMRLAKAQISQQTVHSHQILWYCSRLLWNTGK